MKAESQMLMLMSEAIEKYPTPFLIMGNVNKVLAFQDEIFKRWTFFIDHHFPLVIDQEIITKLDNSFKDLNELLMQMNEYLAAEDDIEESIRGILIQYVTELGKSIDNNTRVFKLACRVAHAR